MAMSNKPDTVSSGPDSPYMAEPNPPAEDHGQVTPADDDLIQHDTAAVPTASDVLQSSARMVQGMMARIGQTGPPMSSVGEPVVQGSSTNILQSAVLNPDGTVSTGIAGDPSGDAQTASSYDPTTNTLTTTTVDPATGSITTTSTSVASIADGDSDVDARARA